MCNKKISVRPFNTYSSVSLKKLSLEQVQNNGKAREHLEHSLEPLKLSYILAEQGAGEF